MNHQLNFSILNIQHVPNLSCISFIKSSSINNVTQFTYPKDNSVNFI